MLVKVGTGGSTVNTCVPEVPPAVLTETVPAPSEAPPVMVTVVVMLVGEIVRAPAETPGLLKISVAPVTKLVPVRVIENDVPVTPEVGLIEVRVGVGGRTVNAWVPVVPPAVVTETVPAPSDAPPVTVTVVVMVVAVIVRAPVETPGLLKVTVAPVTKFVPVRVMENEVPVTPDVGLIALNVGAGGLTVNGWVTVVTPNRLTDTVPAPKAAPALIVTVVVILVGLIVRAPAETPGLLKLSVAPVAKLVPVKVMANEVPVTPEDGLIPVRVGAALTVNV
jgi:hypothetical protein